jgi:regulatory protein
MLLLQKVYRFLSFRDRSEKEIRDYLRNSENIDEIIEKLKEQGLINDEKFAKEWVQSRRRKYGLRRIKQELLQKGIERSIIDQVLSSELRVQSEEQIAENALEKKNKAWENLEAMEFKKKAYGFLVRKGFEYEVVKEVVDNFLQKR